MADLELFLVLLYLIIGVVITLILFCSCIQTRYRKGVDYLWSGGENLEQDQTVANLSAIFFTYFILYFNVVHFK